MLEEFIEKILLLEGKENEVLKEITEKEDTQRFLIDVLQEQLYNTGADGNGKSLGDYAPFTIAKKKRKGDPYDRITLLDTGAFYDSYFITPYLGGFIVDADDEKDDTRLFFKYGDDILKPNAETLEKIGKFYEKKIYEYIQQLL